MNRNTMFWTSLSHDISNGPATWSTAGWQDDTNT
jgi:hypothetical protein